MSSSTIPEGRSALAKNVLGVWGIVFLVLAAVAPLTATIVVTPLGIAVGNGGGMVGAFLIMMVVLLLFAVGFAQMSKILVHAGGFYAFVVKGLGRPMGLVAGFIALIGYNVFVAGAFGTMGFFMWLVTNTFFGLNVPWMIWSLIAIVVVFLLSRRGIAVSVKILMVSLVLEVAIILVMDFSVLFQSGFSFEVFNPSIVFTGSIGVALLFAATGFLGFEATALFSEEAKNPNRTVPRATYIAVAFIGLFAAFTAWAIISAIGVATAQAESIKHLSSGDLVFTIAHKYLGDALLDVMMVLLLVSIFASLLALHNAATRYLFALGRVSILPKRLSHTRKLNGAPVVAASVQLAFVAVVILVYGVAGLDPIAVLTASMVGFGTLCILTLQMLAAASIVVYFRRVKDVRLWKTLIAPGLGGLGLLVIVVLAIFNFPAVAGSDNVIIGQLPWLLLVVLAGGLWLASWLRRSRPGTYAALEDDLENFDQLGIGKSATDAAKTA